MFRQDTTCPALLTLITIMLLRIREYHSVPSAFPCSSTMNILYFWALSRSLAATWEISVDFFSSGY